MNTIYKYQVPIDDRFVLALPEGAEVLSFQTQNGVPVIWARVGKFAEVEERIFRLFGTGHPIEGIPYGKDLHYIGTTQQTVDPPLVWHLFEEVKHG